MKPLHISDLILQQNKFKKQMEINTQTCITKQQLYDHITRHIQINECISNIIKYLNSNYNRKSQPVIQYITVNKQNIVLDILQNLRINDKLIDSQVDFIFEQNDEIYYIKSKLLVKINVKSKLSQVVQQLPSRVLFIQCIKNNSMVYFVLKSKQVFLFTKGFLREYLSVTVNNPLYVPLEGNFEQFMLLTANFYFQTLNECLPITNIQSMQNFIQIEEIQTYEQNQMHSIDSYLSEFTYESQKSKLSLQFITGYLIGIIDCQDIDVKIKKLINLPYILRQKGLIFTEKLMSYIVCREFHYNLCYFIELVDEKEASQIIKEMVWLSNKIYLF